MGCGCGKKNKTIVSTTGQAQAMASSGGDRYSVEADGETTTFASYIEASAFRRKHGGKIRAL